MSMSLIILLNPSVLNSKVIYKENYRAQKPELLAEIGTPEDVLPTYEVGALLDPLYLVNP